MKIVGFLDLVYDSPSNVVSGLTLNVFQPVGASKTAKLPVLAVSSFLHSTLSASLKHFFQYIYGGKHEVKSLHPWRSDDSDDYQVVSRTVEQICSCLHLQLNVRRY